jgi:serine/threonine-protein kinase RsbW
MRPDQASPTTSGPPRGSPDIEALNATVASLRAESEALKAENVALRAACVALDGENGPVEGGEVLEVRLPVDHRAPGAARLLLEVLRGRISPTVLEDAQLVVSELVTNSVRHSGASGEADIVVRVQLSGMSVRLEVADPGSAGVVGPVVPDWQRGGGFGLNLVCAVSELWGLERLAAGGTRVWAQIARAALAGPLTVVPEPEG